MSGTGTTEDVSVLMHFSDTTSTTSRPEFGVYPANDPSSYPQVTTPVELTAPDGNKVTANSILLSVSTKNSDGTYFNIQEFIDPESVVLGHQAQLPLPSPSIDSHNNVIIPAYNFYQYQTIATNPAADLSGSEDSLVSKFADYEDTHGNSILAAGNFIRQHVSAFSQAAYDASLSPEIMQEAEDAAYSGISPAKFLRGAVTTATGGALLTEVTAVGEVLAIGAVGAEALGVGMVLGGLTIAYDSLTGHHTFDRFLNTANESIKTAIKGH